VLATRAGSVTAANIGGDEVVGGDGEENRNI